MLTQLPAKALIACLRLYQISLRPLLGPRCRFYPSCSEYAVTCLKRYAIHKALYKITTRLLRCHPLNPGGVDQP